MIWGLIAALPWFLAIALVSGIVAWSPLGKLLLRFLRDRARNEALLEANNAELTEVTRALATMTERLDATEQLLVRLARAGGPLPPLPTAEKGAPEEAWTPT